MLSATATMLGQQFELPSWMSGDEIAAAQQAAGQITSTADDTPTYPATTESFNVIGKNDYYNNPTHSQYDGSGYSIVVIDTGADLDHPVFGTDDNSDGISDRIVHQQNFIDPESDASDENGHGTNVAGIVAGIATGADLIILKAVGGNLSHVEAALQWRIAHVADYNIIAVNLSMVTGLNSSSATNGELNDEMAMLSNNLFVHTAVSAGNRFATENSTPGVNYPASESWAIAVGATYDANVGTRTYSAFGGATDYTTAQDRIASFSQRHETLLHIFAPGARITGAYLNGGTATYNGTSQAAPHVTAAIALAQQINFELRGQMLTRDEIISLLQDTGVAINDGDDEDGNVTNTGLDFKRLELNAMANKLVPPTITDVILDGSGWTRDPYSFAILAAAGDQLKPIGTQGANTIQIKFSEDVLLDEYALTLYGTNYSTASSDFSISHAGFSYDSNTYVATWTFATLGADKYRLDVTAGITDTAGNALDGDWTYSANGTNDDFSDDAVGAFPSGNGLAGTNGNAFKLYFAILPGDSNHDGIVTSADTSGTIADVNGDGAGDSTDVGIINSNLLGTFLPTRVNGGDYNDDERVEIADYALWRATFGATVTPYAGADGSGNGSVDAADYVVWQYWSPLRGAWYNGVNGFSASIPIVDFENPPQVINVTISGSASIHDPYSFATVVGDGEQLRTVPVGGADTVSITFSEDVNVAQSNLRVVGLYTGNVPTVAEFNYDMATMTASWRFDGWAFGDQYAIMLSEAVTDIEGNLLDGEWVNPASLTTTNTAVSVFPSGDGEQGGDFKFIATILPGDANLDLKVTSADLAILSSHYNNSQLDELFTEGDFTGDGQVNFSDLVLYSPHSGMDLQLVWLLADLDSDWDVDDDDLDTLTNNLGMSNPTWADGDLNGDGYVTLDDLDLMFAQYGLQLDVVS